MNTLLLALIAAILIGIVIKFSIDSYAKSFWNSLEAELCIIPSNDEERIIATISKALQSERTDKLPIIIKHAPNPLMRRMAQDAYQIKKSMGIN